MKKTKFLSLILLGTLIFNSCSKPKNEEALPTPPLPPTETPKVPKLSTSPISGLTLFSVTLGGKIVDTVGSNLIEQGIVVDTVPGATITHNFNKFSMTANEYGDFSRIITHLPSKVTFYIRAYGINQQGVGYGNEVKFTTAQDKPYTGIDNILTSQKAVDDFGANQYTSVLNGLEIVGNDIRDLSSLKTIVNLGGVLNIHHTSLQSLKGLDSLEIIGSVLGGMCDIRNNPYLRDLSALNNVKILNGNIQIVWNSALVTLNTFKSLERIAGGGFGVYDCRNLQSISGLDKFVLLDGDIDIHRNPALTDLSGFRNLRLMTGGLRVSECAALPGLTSFEKLTQMQGISLQFNYSMTNLNGFKSLTKLGSFSADSVPLLNDLSGLNKIKKLESLEIMRCSALTNLKGLSNLDSLEWLKLWWDASLVDLEGLEKVKQATRIEILWNRSLQTLKGLNGLRAITGNQFSLTVASNTAMTSVTGLENLRTVEGLIGFGDNGPNVEYCPLKPFLLQYSGDNFSCDVSGTPVSKAQIISSCP